MDLNGIILKACEKLLFPAIDSMVWAWHTPFEIDDKMWSVIKAKIVEELTKLAPKNLGNGMFVFSGATEGSLLTQPFGSVKQLFIAFIESVVFGVVDEYVKQLHTPMEIDDLVWAQVKKWLSEVLSKVDFVEVSKDNWKVKLA